MEVLPTPNTCHDRGPTWLPPGFRFHPTDEELVVFYLAKKVENPAFTDRAISEVDLNKCEPWDLPGRAKMGEKEWYFYSLRDRKYPTGMRTNRATEAGYWKATGKDKEVMSSRNRCLLGMKKTLVFYKGRAPKGEKTNWVMHEYRLEGDHIFHHLPKLSKDEWVICRIFHKSAGEKKTPYEFRRPIIARDHVSSSFLPPLLESPSLLPHDDCLQERGMMSGSQIFANSASYQQALRAVRRMGEALRYSAVAGEASDNPVGLSKGSPFNFYHNGQIDSRTPVTSGSACLNIAGLQSVSQYGSGLPLANVSCVTPVFSSAMNLPSNAILEALVEQYADSKPVNSKTEPYPQLSSEEPAKFNSRFSEGSLLPLGHVTDSCVANQPAQQTSQSNLKESGSLFQPQVPFAELSAEAFSGTLRGLTRSPSDRSSSLDLENLWAY